MTESDKAVLRALVARADAKRVTAVVTNDASWPLSDIQPDELAALRRLSE